MPKISKEAEAPKPQKKTYSDQELQAFNDELLKYKKITKVKTRSGEDELNIIDFAQYHKDQGSMSNKNTVIIELDAFGEPMLPIKYEEIQEKIQHWSLWKARKEFGQKKRLEELDQLAEGMKMPGADNA